MAVGWAIIGIGKLADIAIAPAIGRQPDSELAAVCSRDLRRADEFGQRHGSHRAYDDFDAMLKDPAVAVVYIATPNGLHRGHALAAIRAGKHVLVDKPMTLAVDEGREMVAAASSQQVLLAVGFQLRHKATNRAARDAIAGGGIGQPGFFELSLGAGKDLYPFHTWRSDVELAGGGTLLNQGTHVIDLLPFLASSPIVEVTCMADSDLLEDVAVATCRLDNGALATLASNQVLSGAPRDWVVIGRGGWLEGRGALAGPPGDEVVLHNSEGAAVLATTTVAAYDEEVDAFTRAILGTAQVNGDGEDGLRNIAVVEALYRSARERRAVAVEPI